MRAKEFIVETAMMGKIADSGKIIRILKKAHTVPFSDEKNWLLVDTDPGKGNSGLGIKWIPADTRFEWVRPYKDSVDENLSPQTIHKLADHKSVKWDDEPSFLQLTKRLTGKEHLDDLDQAGLNKVKKHLDGLQGVAEGSLNEGLAHPVIVVDVQPEYNGGPWPPANPKFIQIMNFVQKQTGPVLFFVNAEDQGLSGDSIQQIQQFWDETLGTEGEEGEDENGDYYYNEPKSPIDWRRFEIVDKGYGYLRSWMDHGIEPATIIATIRELYQQKTSDSRELQFPAFNRRTPQQALIMGAMQEMEDDPISVNWTSVAQLKRFNGAYIVGGARDQCLREVELLMNAFNIRYKRIDSLIYEGQQGVAESDLDKYKKYIRPVVKTTPKIEKDNTPSGRTTDHIEWKVTSPTGEIHRYSSKKQAQAKFDSFGPKGVAEEMQHKKITELFDAKTAFPLQWDNQFASSGEVHAEAYDADGRVIDISFTPSFTPAAPGSVIEIVFKRGGSYDLTGKGDAPRVLATVVKAISQYLQKYQPRYVVFSAKSTGGRAGAYTAMIKRLSRNYTLLDPVEYPEEVMDFLDFLGSDKPFILARS